ncbi:DUF190 domain-containing protein [Endozoicomonadaceae bacterium StTr2]
MRGFQLTFFTRQDQYHADQTLPDWLVKKARSMGFRGATAIVADQGFGKNRHIYSHHILERPKQPVEVEMIVSEDEARSFFALLRREQLNLFYFKVPVEYGMSRDFE